DLGFFALWRLSRLARRREGGKRFFVMRLQHGTGLSTRSGHQLDLRGLLPQLEGEAREIGVLLGKQARLPWRLIMVRVSEEAAQVVRREANRIMVALYEGGLASVLGSIVRCMRSGCRIERRTSHPSTVQLLLEGLDWELTLT